MRVDSSRWPNSRPVPPLLDAVAATLGVDQSDPVTIGRGLDDIGILVLDNVEHLTDCDTGVRDLLGIVDHSVTILATSRRPLDAQDERCLALKPLARAAAITLLRQRVDETNGLARWHTEEETVGSICERLDDVPLAIELVAAWSSALAPRAVLAPVGSAAHPDR